MPDDTNRTSIQIAWINFVKSVKLLLLPQTDDRPLDQYLPFRDAVLNLVQNDQFLAELNATWAPPVKPDNPTPTEIHNALLLELQAFPLAVEVAQATSKPEETKSWYWRLLGRASIGVGSIKDILSNLPPYAKHALTLYKELIDLFKEKG